MKEDPSKSRSAIQRASYDWYKENYIAKYKLGESEASELAHEPCKYDLTVGCERLGIPIAYEWPDHARNPAPDEILQQLSNDDEAGKIVKFQGKQYIVVGLSALDDFDRSILEQIHLVESTLPDLRAELGIPAKDSRHPAGGMFERILLAELPTES